MTEIEQIERKCLYCHEDGEGYIKAFGAFWLYRDKFHGWMLHAGKCKPRPISFCPICGRSLNND